MYVSPKLSGKNFLSDHVEYWVPGRGQESYGKPKSKMQETRADLATQQSSYSSSVVSWIFSKGDILSVSKGDTPLKGYI